MTDDDDALEGELVPPHTPPPLDMRREVLVLRAAAGVVPPEPAALRRAVIRIACAVELGGPAPLGIDPATPEGREAWRDVVSAIRWLYAAANDRPSPLGMRRPPSKQPRGRDAGL
jgi:hypothetical protein